MRFSSLILKNLCRRPFRTGLTLVALITAVASVVALRGIAVGFVASFTEVYASHSVDVVVTRQGTADRLSSSVPQQAIASIESIAGVRRVAGVLLDTLSLERQQVFGVPTMGIEQASWLRDDYHWQSKWSDGPEPEKQLCLGIHLAERIGASVGDSLEIFEEPYVVTGVFESPSVWENGSMMVPLAELQVLLGRPDQVTYVNVVLDESTGRETVPEIVDAITEIDSRLHAMATDEFIQTDTRMKIAGAMASMTSLIAFVIGAIGTLNTMMTSVLERTQEIGVLRAVGWPRRLVITMVLSESMLLAAVASVLGCVLAFVAIAAMSSLPEVRGIVTAEINPRVFAEGVFLALLIGFLGAILPARRAASIAPTEAMRSAVI